jgi:hypothetical protein
MLCIGGTAFGGVRRCGTALLGVASARGGLGGMRRLGTACSSVASARDGLGGVRRCVCVFWPPVSGGGPVKHAIPIASLLPR